MRFLYDIKRPGQFVLLLFTLILQPDYAFALVPHDYPAVYTNVIGRIFFLVSCVVLIIYLRRNGLHRVEGWRHIYLSLTFFNLWNIDMMVARSSELWIIGEIHGLKYLEQQVYVGRFIDLLIYMSNFDYALLNIAMFLFYLGLRRLRTREDEASASAMFPYFPIIIFDIVGSIVFLTLSCMCLYESLQLLKQNRENIIWNYMVWLTASYALYALSRTMGYTIRHLFLALELDNILAYLEPFTGSINTLTFIWLGTVSLFFIRFYPIYLRVSEDKRKIEEINADIIGLNKELEDLVAERTMAILGLSVADKVRNPVAIIGCVSKRLLSKEKLSEKVEGNLRDIVDECKKLESIVNDFEGILKNRQRMFRYVDLNEIVKDIVLLIRDDINKKGVNLKVNLSDSPAKINAQKNLIRAAIFHLLKNAIDATPPGGSIEIVTKSIGDSVVVEIIDSGSGIPEELLTKIFEPFFSTRENRIGMGLPLVRQIVAEHLGEIKVTSEVGKGTSFEMIFPVKWCVIAEDVRRGVSNGVKG